LNHPFYQVYNSEGLTLVRDLEQHYLNGSVPELFPSREYFINFLPSLPQGIGITYENLLPNLGIHSDKNPNGSNEYKAQSHFENLIDVLTFRKSADEDEVFIGSGETEVAEKYGINLFKDEVLVLSNGFTSWKEEKTQTTGVTYGGFRMSVGNGSLKNVLGHVKMIRHKETFFDTYDSGTTFITNKRIIFVGNNKRNKSIRLDKIVNVEFFKDGIYIGKENGVSPMITVPVLSSDNQSPWTYKHQLTSRIPEMAVTINRLLHNDVEVKVS
jgi:hypothetical protein